MQTIKKCGAQGDVMFRRVECVPKEAVKKERSGDLIVAHSETGHNHVIKALDTKHFELNPFVCYLQMGTDVVEIEHQRPWDTHETLRLLGKPGDVWEVRRQREWVPEGWRRVED